MDRTLRCSYCGAVIGEHEPIIVLRDGGEVREATTALASAASPGARECYHRRCYEVAFSQLKHRDT